MKRRNFLKTSLFAFLALNPILSTPLRASELSNKIFINVFLDGGFDFRQLFVPLFTTDESSYGYAFWKHRLSLYSLDSLDEVNAFYDSHYETLSIDGNNFGISKKASWLKEQILGGNFTIVNNVVGSQNRSHVSGVSYMEGGSANANQNGSGWGGRLAQEVGGNMVSLSKHLRLFCNGATANNSPIDHDNSSVISLYNGANSGIYEFKSELEPDVTLSSPKPVLSRAIHSYYQAKYEELKEGESVYKKVTTSYHNTQKFKVQLQQRVAQTPANNALQNLTGAFGKQTQNLYDALISQDILNMKVGSMEDMGCDTHRLQFNTLEDKINYMFNSSDDGCLSILYQNLPQSMKENIVFVFNGEFGRQLASNGDKGTDHGRGNSILLVGKPLGGKILGEMFPQSEIAKFAQSSSDIEGKTEVTQVYAKLCEWLGADASRVLPNYGGKMVEDGVDLGLIVTSVN